MSAPRQRDRLLAIDLTKMWVDHAVLLGAQRVMINQGQPTHENKAYSIPALKTMVDYGKSKDIIVSVETRGGGGGAAVAAPGPGTAPAPHRPAAPGAPPAAVRRHRAGNRSAATRHGTRTTPAAPARQHPGRAAALRQRARRH